MKTDINTINISIVGNNPTLDYAAQELSRYLQWISGENITVMKSLGESYSNRIVLGTFNSLSLSLDIRVDDPEFDDAIYIEVKNGKGIISGVNNRSVLLAVYRFLTEAGCRWVRPGKEGEYIPKRVIQEINVNVMEKPSYRHRGICIEGANTRENILDIIEWMPKMGFNTYFIQFREAYTFYERWYNHKKNPLREPEGFSIEDARKYTAEAIKEIKKRDLLHHAVGHGWTCEPFGIPGLGWDRGDYQVTPDIQKYLAEVDGKREIWGGIPLNTNLCYSNVEVRKIMNSSIVDYLKEHKQVDVLHFWLADGWNNHCECRECRQKRPSDYYVMMLNELDAMLTSENITTKVVFLIYVDLLWAPSIEKIRNPDRFILMFAPITRTYSKGFIPHAEMGETPEYLRNKLDMPKSVEANLAFLKEWQKTFDGDSFDFDYHLYVDHYKDPGLMQMADVIHTDVVNLANIGLNGYISCQVQRIFLPSGFAMHVLARTLWDRHIDINTQKNDYFISSFGPDGMACMEFLNTMSKLFYPAYLRDERERDIDLIKSYAQIEEVVQSFAPVIDKNLDLENSCHRLSWKYLKLYSHMCILLSKALLEKAKGNKSEAKLLWRAAKEYTCSIEDEIQPVFDVYKFVVTFDSVFGEERD